MIRAALFASLTLTESLTGTAQETDVAR